MHTHRTPWARSAALLLLAVALGAGPALAKGKSSGPSVSCGAHYDAPDKLVPYDQGFETGTDGWFDVNNGGYGLITAVASGTDGIPSPGGTMHAVVEGDGSSASFSRFDGYRDTWTGTWIAEIKVFLDPSWDAGTGFDYSVAASGSDGNHQRDYIFHVTKDTSSGLLFVAGSNNTNFAPREDLDTLANSYVVTSDGWYTLQHVFRDDAGSLAVDLNLLDDTGTVVFTETRTNAADTIPTEVGGNRYSWFTFVNVDGGVAVDDHRLCLTYAGPEGPFYLRCTAQVDKKGGFKGSFKFEIKDTGEKYKGRSVTDLVVDGDAGTATVSGTCRLGKDASPTGDDYLFTASMIDGSEDAARVRIWYVDGGSDIVVHDDVVHIPLTGGSIVVRD